MFSTKLRMNAPVFLRLTVFFRKLYRFFYSVVHCFAHRLNQAVLSVCRNKTVPRHIVDQEAVESGAVGVEPVRDHRSGGADVDVVTRRDIGQIGGRTGKDEQILADMVATELAQQSFVYIFIYFLFIYSFFILLFIYLFI